MEKLNLSLDDIENKVFSVDFKGYSSYEVDVFLDDVMEDIQTYESEIKRLNDLSKHYENLISELSQENQHLKAKIATSEALSPTQPSTLDLIRRVSRLEELVLKNQDKQ